MRTAVGMPGAARSVPGGVSRRSAYTPSARPGRARPTSASGSPVVIAAVNSAVPAATSTASGRRRRSEAAAFASASTASGGGATARSAGVVVTAATTTSGRSPRKTARQPIVSPTIPAIAGPITPGKAHAVESHANIRGRSSSGMLRAIAT